jgi:hypothetical protein
MCPRYRKVLPRNPSRISRDGLRHQFLQTAKIDVFIPSAIFLSFLSTALHEAPFLQTQPSAQKLVSEEAIHLGVSPVREVSQDGSAVPAFQLHGFRKVVKE